VAVLCCSSSVEVITSITVACLVGNFCCLQILVVRRCMR
jgi:hypothetical protein